MNKQPQPGEWWKTREGKRVYIAAVMPDWFTGLYPLRVFSGTAEIDSEKYTRDGGYHFDGLQSGRDLIEHLPECTGWDWQPVKYPRYFETHNREDYAFLRQDSATDFVLVRYNGTGDEVTVVTLANRAGLTEAEAMSRIVPPTPPTRRTIAFCEYVVWDDPGCERLVWVLESDDLLYRYRYPTGLTRTVEVPE
jgi:hypothetical protein